MLMVSPSDQIHQNNVFQTLFIRGPISMPKEKKEKKRGNDGRQRYIFKWRQGHQGYDV